MSVHFYSRLFFVLLSQERISKWYAIPVRGLLLLLLICLCSSSCAHLVIACILRAKYNGEGRSVIGIVNLTTQTAAKVRFWLFYVFFERGKWNEYIMVIPCPFIHVHVSSCKLLNILGWKKLYLAGDLHQMLRAKLIFGLKLGNVIEHYDVS
jgi:hypothetical protein